MLDLAEGEWPVGRRRRTHSSVGGCGDGCLNGSGQAKIGDFGHKASLVPGSCTEEDVAAAHVPMQNVLAVQVAQGCSYFQSRGPAMYRLTPFKMHSYRPSVKTSKLTHESK